MILTACLTAQMVEWQTFLPSGAGDWDESIKLTQVTHHQCNLALCALTKLRQEEEIFS